MKRYVCLVCGYVYDEVDGDPDNGVEPGTKWDDVPEGDDLDDLEELGDLDLDDEGSAPPPKPRKVRPQEVAAKAMDRPNTTHKARRMMLPPSEKASPKPTKMMAAVPST